jgi:hypothetical protein
MIPRSKEKQAYYCLHMLFVWIRQYARTSAPSEDIALMADHGHALPGLFVADADLSDEFRKHFEKLAGRFPWARHLVDVFDSPSAPDPSDGVDGGRSLTPRGTPPVCPRTTAVGCPCSTTAPEGW